MQVGQLNKEKKRVLCDSSWPEKEKEDGPSFASESSRKGPTLGLGRGPGCRRRSPSSSAGKGGWDAGGVAGSVLLPCSLSLPVGVLLSAATASPRRAKEAGCATSPCIYADESRLSLLRLQKQRRHQIWLCAPSSSRESCHREVEEVVDAGGRCVPSP
jgi:hypothetical protein